LEEGADLGEALVGGDFRWSIEEFVNFRQETEGALGLLEFETAPADLKL
jgi:hypothetical protein